MAAYCGETDPDFDPANEVDKPNEDTDRPMVGRAVINIPLPPGWDDHR